MTLRPFCFALIGACLCVGATGCSLCPPKDLASRPVVELGSTPTQEDAVLKLSAGQPIAARAEIRGSLLAQTAHSDMTVALARDLYLYKEWASFDRVHWKRAGQLVQSSIKVETPSAQSPQAGLLLLEFDDRTLPRDAAAVH